MSDQTIKPAFVGQDGHQHLATITVPGDHTIKTPCGTAAPLVVNGAIYVGCSLPRDHEGDHSITITWRR
jgi:hypothetical protein